MTRRELVFLASRAFAMLLISWAFVELTYLPERLFALFHHMGQRSVLAAHDYFSTYYLIIVVFNILRMLTMVVAAALFWRCGSQVEALLSPVAEQQ